MPDSKITALTALTAADPAVDMFPIVDVSDTSMAASGTTKRISINNLLAASGTATLASATISGDLTVRTNKLAVTSTGVGCGVATPLVPLHAETAATGTTAFSNVVSTFRSQAAGRDATLQFSDGTNQALISMLSGALSFGTAGSNTRYNIDATGISTWSVGGSTAMTLNSTGLGVGVTPSAWFSTWKVLQLAGGSFGGPSDRSFSLQNAIVNASGQFQYVSGSSTPASGYRQYNGAHDWYTAAAGTSPNQITDFATAKMTLDASGVLMVGTTNSVIWNTTNTGCVVSGNAFQASRSDDVSLLLNRLGSNGKIALFARQGGEVGDISVTTTGTTFNSTSDYRLKEAVAPLSGGLARVNALKPSIYNWKSNGSTGEGFLAHELAEVVPAAVTGEKDAVNEDGSIKAQSIDMSRVVPILVAAIQELTARVQTLEAK